MVFGVGAAIVYWYGGVSDLECQWKWHRYYIAAGIADALNGLFVVYTLFLGYVSGPLGMILSHLNIPFILFFSRVVGVGDRHFSRGHIVALFFFPSAILLGLLPLYIRLGTEGEVQVHSPEWWVWPFFIIAGWIPCALMQVIHNKCQDDFKRALDRDRLQHPSTTTTTIDTTTTVQSLEHNSSKRISVLWFQAWESIYQWLFFVIFFWIDLVPGFGFHTSWSKFWDVFTLNMRCVMSPTLVPSEYSDRCAYSSPLVPAFYVSALLSYMAYVERTKYTSTTTLSTLTCAPTIMLIVVWSVAPLVNLWSDKEDIDTMDLLSIVSAVVPVSACLRALMSP